MAMLTSGEIRIPLSKFKISLLLIGSLLFVAASLCMIIFHVETFFFRNKNVIIFIGVCGVLFFGVTTLFALRKLLDTKPGIIIDKNGIIDNSNSTSLGVIKWSDISEIKIDSINGKKVLVILVNNPDDYIQRDTNAFTRKALEVNYKYLSTPIVISTATLNCRFEDLVEIVQSKFKEINRQIN
jgi:hypothetical protein